MATDEPRTHPDLAERVVSLASHFSIEVTPKEVARYPGLLAGLLNAGTRVYTTFLANTPFDDTVAAATSLIRQGMTPVPHLAARSVHDEADLDRMVGQLAAAGVTELLLIGGSVSRPRGVISDSTQVLRSGVLARHGIERIGVAGHPEGNKDIGDPALALALADKNAFARDSGADVYLLTQFCFAAEPIVGWERRIRAAGNRLPVVVGLAGLSSPMSLLKFGLACGVGPSLKVLRKQAGGMLKLATADVYRPDQPLLGVARAVQADPGCLIRGAHFFPFGALRPTVSWADRLSKGHFEIDEMGERVVISDGTA